MALQHFKRTSKFVRFGDRIDLEITGKTHCHSRFNENDLATIEKTFMYSSMKLAEMKKFHNKITFNFIAIAVKLR